MIVRDFIYSFSADLEINLIIQEEDYILVDVLDRVICLEENYFNREIVRVWVDTKEITDDECVPLIRIYV